MANLSFFRGINEIVFAGVFESYFDCVYEFFGIFCFLFVFLSNFSQFFQSSSISMYDDIMLQHVEGEKT